MQPSFKVSHLIQMLFEVFVIVKITTNLRENVFLHQNQNSPNVNVLYCNASKLDENTSIIF